MSMQAGWDAEAADWAQFARGGHDRSHTAINLPAFLELLPAPGRRTLDLACGEGRLGRLLQSQGHRVAGVDASAAMVRFAVTHEHPEPAVVGDAARLPFQDGSFDLVLAYMCLHDIDAMPEAVGEIARVLAPWGRLCAAIPHPVSSAGSFQGDSAVAPFVIPGSYLTAAPSRMTVERDGMRLTFHSEHRPLEAYSRALEAGGLLTEAVREVRPDDEAAQQSPAVRRWQRIPLYLHLRAVKPGGR
jgi:SAM-dependent methyltransferase